MTVLTEGSASEDGADRPVPATPVLLHKLLDGLSANLDEAQTDLVAAELTYMEAAAERRTALEAVSRLKAAVAALQGEPPLPEKEVKVPTSAVAEGKAVKKPKNNPNNPLEQLKCSGCGRTGSMQEQYVQSPGGATVRTLVCGTCNNQAF